MDTKDLIIAVRKHAAANYNRDGWDYVVECYTDEEIEKAIEGVSTIAGAIRKIGKGLKERDSYHADIEAEEF